MTAIRPGPTGPLPPKQAAVLDFIQAEVDSGRAFPTMGAIAKLMGWRNEHSAFDCLTRLAWRGRLRCVRTNDATRARRYHWELAA